MFNQEEANRLIPERMHGGIKRYLENGIAPGGFLQAIITNNLKEAIGRADIENQSILRNYVEFFYNYTPSSCWGSEEKMLAWLNGFSKAVENGN